MAYIVSQRACTSPSLDHRVCIAVCTCTPRLSSTLYGLLELYLSVFLVVILSHPRLCTVAAVAPYPAVCIRCGLEACGVCLWCVCVCTWCVCRVHQGVVQLVMCVCCRAAVHGAAVLCPAAVTSEFPAQVLTLVMHARVGRFRQAIAMHMALGPCVHQVAVQLVQTQ